MTGRALGRRRRARRRPAARRLAAHRRRRDRPPPGRGRCSPRTSTGSRSRRRATPAPSRSQVAGPWTLAATVEKPRGDKVLTDHGARRDLAQALAEGRARTTWPTYAAGCPASSGWSCRSTSPRCRPCSAAQVPTASGFGRHRTVHPPEASEALGWVLDAIADAGAEPWVHSLRARRAVGAAARRRRRGLVGRPRPCCGRRPRRARRGARRRAVRSPSASCPRPTRPTRRRRRRVTERVLRWLDMLGLDPGEVGRPARAHPGLRPGRAPHRGWTPAGSRRCGRDEAAPTSAEQAQLPIRPVGRGHAGGAAAAAGRTSRPPCSRHRRR